MIGHARGLVDRSLTDGLSPRAEARLRRHLAACAACRDYYEQGLALVRAAAGASGERPARSERERAEARLMAAVGLPSSAPAIPERLTASLVWRPWAYAATAALVVATSAWLVWPDPVRVSGVRGKVTVAGVPLRPGDALPRGAEVATGDGQAELDLGRGRVVQVFPHTRVRFAPSGKMPELAEGRVRCKVERGKGSFEVRTAEAVARVLGTSFVVERDPDTHVTEVRVAEGEVLVTSVDRPDSPLRVKAGRKTKVLAGQAPERPKQYDPDSDQRQWNLGWLTRAIKRGWQGFKDWMQRQ